MKILSIYLSIIVIGLTACAANTHTNTTNNLLSIFEEYKLVSNKSDNKQLKYFTPKMWNELQKYRNNPINSTNEIETVANSFPFELTKMESSQEIIENGIGCLVVHGQDQKNQPMDYFIEFVKQEGRWVIDNYETVIYDDSERWLTEPVCDPAKRQQLYDLHFHAEADN